MGMGMGGGVSLTREDIAMTKLDRKRVVVA